MAHGTYNNPRAGSKASALRMREMVDKVNGDTSKMEKIPTLGAKKIIPNKPGYSNKPVTGNRKDLFLDRWSSQSIKENRQQFQEGQWGDAKELRGYISEVNKSKEPVLRNPGDRAARNKKLGKKFDRGY